jgi:hypothetical protein
MSHDLKLTSYSNNIVTRRRQHFQDFQPTCLRPRLQPRLPETMWWNC